MKKLLLTFIFLCFLLPITSKSQIIDTNTNKKFVYCELVGTQQFLSMKINVSIDYGQQKRLFQNNYIKDQNGEIKDFNSMVDAMNYMGENGWEFVQAYIVTSGQIYVYHWLLKKEIKQQNN